MVPTRDVAPLHERQRQFIIEYQQTIMFTRTIDDYTYRVSFSDVSFQSMLFLRQEIHKNKQLVSYNIQRSLRRHGRSVYRDAALHEIRREIRSLLDHIEDLHQLHDVFHARDLSIPLYHHAVRSIPDIYDDFNVWLEERRETANNRATSMGYRDIFLNDQFVILEEDLDEIPPVRDIGPTASDRLVLADDFTDEESSCDGAGPQGDMEVEEEEKGGSDDNLDDDDQVVVGAIH